jgi:hypothetical protein
MTIADLVECRIPYDERGLSATERVGNCYRLAAKVVAYGGDSDAVLVHGMISTEGGGPNEHAWVELSNGNCYDAVLDLEVTADAYERLFGAVATSRYDRVGVFVRLCDDQTWGPWT